MNLWLKDKKLQRYLAFDLGEKRIGLSVSDELGYTAQPLPTIKLERGGEVDLAKIEEVIAEYNITSLVVGLPRHMSGNIGKSGKKALEFAQRLKEKFNLPVIMWDERLTTAYAERTLKDLGVRGKKRRNIIDSISAQLILQSYLNNNYRRKVNTQ